MPTRSVRDIDAVAAVYQRHCERLLLAQNYIRSLAGVAQFAALQHLSLSHNLIADLGELRCAERGWPMQQ